MNDRYQRNLSKECFSSKASNVAKASKKGGEAQRGEVGQVGQYPRKQLRTESSLSPELEQLVYDLIGIGMRVHTTFGPGCARTFTKMRMSSVSRKRTCRTSDRVPFNVTYLGRSVRPIRVDLVIENQVIVELKAVTQLHDIHSSPADDVFEANGASRGADLELQYAASEGRNPPSHHSRDPF